MQKEKSNANYNWKYLEINKNNDLKKKNVFRLSILGNDSIDFWQIDFIFLHSRATGENLAQFSIFNRGAVCCHRQFPNFFISDFKATATSEKPEIKLCLCNVRMPPELKNRIALVCVNGPNLSFHTRQSDRKKCLLIIASGKTRTLPDVKTFSTCHEWRGWLWLSTSTYLV